MASHAPQTLFFVTNEGSVSTSGGSTRIAKGQIGLVDKGGVPTAAGMPVVTSVTPIATDRNRLYELRLGIAPLTPTRSQSNKAYSTVPFKLSEIVDVHVNYPKMGVSVDEFLIGYDGINANSALVMNNGDNEVIDITLFGEAIGMLGYPEAKVTVKLYLEAPNTGTFTMHEIVEKGVERLKDVTLVGGVSILNYIDITPVNSTNPTLATLQLNDVPSTFYRLTVKDKGNHTALGLVQAQYPTLVVKRESYVPGAGEAGVSTYVVIGNGLPADYSLSVAALADANCDGTPELTTTTSTIAWVAGATCAAIQETFTLQLKDDDCGNNKLAAVKAAYPELNILVDTASANWTQTGTVAGLTTGETLSIVLGGVTYNTAGIFATDIATTITNWVAGNAAAILAATGATVAKGTGNTIVFTDLSEGFNIAAAANSTFTLTLGNLTNVGTATTGACQTVYRAIVTSGVVCEECSPILRDLFVVSAPAPFQGIHWVQAPVTYSSTALMGIRLKGKVNIFAGGEEYRDELPFVYSSTRLSIANAAPGMVSESFNVGTNGRFAVKLMSIATEPEAVGGQFYDMEERTRVYFENRQRLAGNNFGKLVLGQESHLKPLSQYVDYVVSVRTNRFAQSFSGEVVENFDYHILVEVGKASGVHSLLTTLAAGNGITLPALVSGY
jgi:hypothetical protein